MKTIVVYATRYGCTEKCAGMLAEKLGGEVELCNLKRDRVDDLSAYDRVVIGGSIYIGKIQKEVTAFCTKHLNELKEKQVGLFICCMSEEAAEKQLHSSFPPELLARASARGCFGGEFIFGRMKGLDRFIAKKVSKAEQDVFRIDETRIAEFARTLNTNSALA
ncbi:MAG TPA: flavodoxin domain-containing protein [Bacillota bacterium]|nr:flavodoxin domain-containing protein [Bacillota bacterium]